MSKLQDIESLKKYVNSLNHDIDVLSEYYILSKVKEFQDGLRAKPDLGTAIKSACYCIRKERDRLDRAIIRLQKLEREGE
jgi:division protein CdvB (Snf7/Vps24/ESCRT-III family)